MSGNACKIFRRSSLAHTINAFIGRLMWPLDLFGSRTLDEMMAKDGLPAEKVKLS